MPFFFTYYGGFWFRMLSRKQVPGTLSLLVETWLLRIFGRRDTTAAWRNKSLFVIQQILRVKCWSKAKTSVHTLVFKCHVFRLKHRRLHCGCRGEATVTTCVHNLTNATGTWFIFTVGMSLRQSPSPWLSISKTVPLDGRGQYLKRLMYKYIHRRDVEIKVTCVCLFDASF